MKNWTNINQYTPFLILLRAGLWGEKALLPRPLSVSEWNGIWKFAQMQCMLGIVFDGIETLPENQKPPQEILLRWILFVVQIEKQNLIVNTKADEIYTKLKEVDINTVLIKGQGIAQEYIRPNHRQSGDIDLFICDDQINKAKYEIVKMNPEKIEEDMKHFSFDSDGIHIELHRSTIGPQIFHSRNKLKKWLDNRLNTSHKKFGNITIPDTEFNVVFEFYHFFHHFMNGGVGLRQICDWCRCLHNTSNELDIIKLEWNLNRFSLLSAWKVFGCVSVLYLGLHQEKMPFYDDKYEDKAESVMKIIMKEGNFGINSNRNKHPKNYLLRKMTGMKNNIKSSIEMFPLFPKESIKNIKNPIDSFGAIYLDLKNRR